MITISTNLIEKFNLKSDYISTFEKLNGSNTKYSAIKFLYKDDNDLNYLKEFNINFKEIKCLLIKQERNSFIKNYDYFFQNLFSFYNINNNLVYLEIDIYLKMYLMKKKLK